MNSVVVYAGGRKLSPDEFSVDYATGVVTLIGIKVSDCRDCPFRYSHRGHGECWEECSHKDHKRDPYQNILWGCQREFSQTPIWCPLSLGVEKRSGRLADESPDASAVPPQHAPIAAVLEGLSSGVPEAAR